MTTAQQMQIQVRVSDPIKRIIIFNRQLHGTTILVKLHNYYRPRTYVRWEVMFSQVCVCSGRGGLEMNSVRFITRLVQV